MKAMILAAGEGKRMQPLTQATPKPLLKVHGIPLITHHLIHLAQAGITDVIINVFHLADIIMHTLGNGQQYGVNIHYSDERPYGQRLETGGGIRLALPLLGDAPFIVLSADIVTNFDLKTLQKPKETLAHLVLVKNPIFHPQGDFSLNDAGLIVKNIRNPMTYANIGIFSPELFASLAIAHLPLSAVLMPRIHQQQISGEVFQGQWDNIGTPEQLAHYQSNIVK